MSQPKEIRIDSNLFLEMYKYVLLSEQGEHDPTSALKIQPATLLERCENVITNMDEYVIVPPVDSPAEGYGQRSGS